MNLTKCISRNQQEPRLNGGSTERPSRLRISSKERARVASDSNGKSDALMSVNSVLVTREQSRKHWKSGLGLQTRRLPEKGPRLWGVAGLGKAGVVWALAQKRTKPHQAYNEPVSHYFSVTGFLLQSAGHISFEVLYEYEYKTIIIHQLLYSYVNRLIRIPSALNTEGREVNMEISRGKYYYYCKCNGMDLRAL